MNGRGRACRGLALPPENNADAPTFFDHPNGVLLRAQPGRGPS
jgi:hypothetical protein